MRARPQEVQFQWTKEPLTLAERIAVELAFYLEHAVGISPRVLGAIQRDIGLA